MVPTATRFVASDSNATLCPSPEIAATSDWLLACASSSATDTRVVAPLCTLRTKISQWLLVSPAARLLAMDVNVT
jgi:hypothetical protein